MSDPQRVLYAALILRLALAALFFAHAWLKLAVFTPAGTVQYFQSLGLPGFVAYVTIAGELAVGAGLLLGVLTRIAALGGLVIVVGTIVTVHGSKGWLFTNKDGGWEYPAFWAVALIVQALLGDGAWALGPSLAL
ncbi:MAG: DoxX family protein [Alphaproteobacteria bacterium]|nr:DoxX family protein [Alphaproteobacteria bacterium]